MIAITASTTKFIAAAFQHPLIIFIILDSSYTDLSLQNQSIKEFAARPIIINIVSASRVMYISPKITIGPTTATITNTASQSISILFYFCLQRYNKKMVSANFFYKYHSFLFQNTYSSKPRPCSSVILLTSMSL